MRENWPHQQEFEAWKETTCGGWLLNKFIREAIRCVRNGERPRSKGIWESLRSRLGTLRAQFSKKHPDIKPTKLNGFGLNNNLTPYAARYAEQASDELKGQFRFKDLGSKNKKRAVVVIPRERLKDKAS